jgi:hypothetical protein
MTIRSRLTDRLQLRLAQLAQFLGQLEQAPLDVSTYAEALRVSA